MRSSRAGVPGAAATELTAGPLRLSAVFALKIVKIYENGYVRVGGGLLSRIAPFERLTSIEASSDMPEIEARGSAGAALWRADSRGEAVITIVTDHTTHVLRERRPTSLSRQAAERLVAAGRAVIGAGPVPPADDHTRSVAARLRELRDLHDEGLVTDDEYQRLRAKVLDSF